MTAGTRPLRILLAHNRYQVRGGEDAAVSRDLAALERAGCAVEAVFLDNEAIDSGLARLRAAAAATHAPDGIARVMAAARRFGPDVVHVHNFFPLLSPGIHAAARAAGCATVQTLHNYRLICANAFLMRDGAPCELCVTGSPYRAVRFACYRGSRVGSLAVARMIDRHRRAGTWERDVDRFIALTPFARERFVAAGFPAEKIRIRPNGLPDPGPPADGPRRNLLYVGRLSPEKGVTVLAEAAALAGMRVTVIGEGPLAGALAGHPALDLRGALPPDAVQAAMARACVLVVPSLWYEGLPMVVAEAFAAGTPVVASRIGALAGLVDDGATGLLAEPGDAADLARALGRIAGDPASAAAMGREARAVYEREWHEDVTTRTLLDIYRDAVAARAADAPLARTGT
ncbi:glycosyltransferase family 4 protein [Methylobacterium sp. SyP6R]|uniref:glycosyltransferase family 4 protein n=1 Tax=Methylobacterium sp. SyP6R TaxID=2718876 RepID=UPI001F3135C7|nr:glycosyltransferase family 4 protein [Methylobacterium sp. SyP6R]MCF4127577.1 glycosyltransferase family 4 protein [Methylobacterium sp. SyP6R]